MKKSKIVLLHLFVFVFISSFFYLPLEINNQIAGQEAYALSQKQLSLKEKRASYFEGNNGLYRTNKNIKILIVPGHDEASWGAEHDGVKEVDINRQLAGILYDKLKQEKGFNVAMVSDKDGYSRTFKKFFKKEEDEIEDFIKKRKKDFKKKVRRGQIELKETNFHNAASDEVAAKLYGINMWSDENEFDLVIHVHFNDYGGRYKDWSPKYNGFSIYVPEEQFENHEVSFEFAENIFKRLSDISAVSNLKYESEGIVKTQELIAIGAHESLETPALLIEYGYIYEPQFTNPDVRDRAVKELANKTYLGIKDYFDELVLDTENYLHAKDLRRTDNVWNEENYMLQKELASKGFYPPKGKTFNECPVAGYFGSCTEEAVMKFQKAYKLPSTGFVGPLTRQLLNIK